MEDLCKKSFAVLSLLAVLAASSAQAWESHSTWAPRLKTTLYTAKFEWKRTMLSFKLGTVDREELGRSRVMAVITSKKGVQGVCERVLSKGGTRDLDSIPMTCTGSMFAPMSRVSATFVISNSLAHPVLRLGSMDELAAR